MQVIILGAGRGERLWPLTRNTPKCLLELVDGMSVLDMQMQALSMIPKIDEIVYVIGYLAEQVEAKLVHYSGHQPSVRTVYNPFFADSNNLVSLWLALAYVRDEFIVVNGDDIYDSTLPQGLINEDPKKDVLMTIDRKNEYDHDDMKVVTKEDRVLKIGKDIDLAEANAESIGMIRFHGYGARRFKEAVNRLVRLPIGREVFWLKAVQHLIDDGHPVRWYQCEPSDWAEIDFHPDLQLIRGSLLDRHTELLHMWSRPGSA